MKAGRIKQNCPLVNNMSLVIINFQLNAIEKCVVWIFVFFGMLSVSFYICSCVCERDKWKHVVQWWWVGRGEGLDTYLGVSYSVWEHLYFTTLLLVKLVRYPLYTRSARENTMHHTSMHPTSILVVSLICACECVFVCLCPCSDVLYRPHPPLFPMSEIRLWNLQQWFMSVGGEDQWSDIKKSRYIRESPHFRLFCGSMLLKRAAKNKLN